MSRAFVVIYSGLMVGMGPMSIDGYAPLQGMVGDGLRVSPEQALLGMSYLVFSMGLFQVFAGPLSDRFGRKPVFLFGLSAFIAGSAICMLAGNLATLLAGRVLQGMGASAGQIVGRAILRDLYTGPDLAHTNSGSMGTMSAVVFLTPLASFLVADAWGWNATFGVFLAYGAAMLIVTALAYRETLPEPNEDALNPAGIRDAARALLAHPQSRTFLAVLVVSGAAMFSYVISAQYVYEREYGVTGLEFAVLYSLIGLGVFSGQMLNRVLIHRIGTLPTATLSIGAATATCLAGLALSALGLLGAHGFACIVFVFAMGTLMCVSNSMALVLDPHGRIAGFASSMMGFLTFVFGAAVGTAVAWLSGGSATATLGCMTAAVLLMLILVADWLWRARHRHAPAAG